MKWGVAPLRKSPRGLRPGAAAEEGASCVFTAGTSPRPRELSPGFNPPASVCRGRTRTCAAPARAESVTSEGKTKSA